MAPNNDKAHLPEQSTVAKNRKGYSRSSGASWYARHGRELMGCKSPVREPMVFIVMDTNKSTSRRQGRLREEGSEGSRSANVRDDEQKPYRRLSPWASRPITTKPAGSWGRVNAAFVHGKLTRSWSNDNNNKCSSSINVPEIILNVPEIILRRPQIPGV